MWANRRELMIGIGATVAGISAGSSVIASEHTSLYFETIDVEGDFVVIGNAGDEDFDLSGYIINWEYNQDQDQTDEIPDGIVVPAGGSVKLASGYDESAAEDADHDFGYEAGRIRDDGTDTVAIHEPGMGSVVIVSDDHTDPPEDSGGEEEGEGEGGSDTDDGEDGSDEGDGESDESETEDGQEEETEEESTDVEEDDGDDSAQQDQAETTSGDESEDNCPEEERQEEPGGEDCPEEEPEPEPEDDCP